MPRRGLRRSLAAVLVLLAAPSVAEAQVRGSSLAGAPNANIGCGNEIDLDDAAGAFKPVPGGQGSCTWWSAGVAGQPESTATGAVPGQGVITRVRFRSGPNPSPVQVVILRAVQSPVTALVGATCCAGTVQSEVIKPVPNGITDVPVRLPVFAGALADGSLAVQDSVGLSAVNDGGTLPIHDPGPAGHQLTSADVPGTPLSVLVNPRLATDFVPRLDTQQAPGWELLLQYEFQKCPDAGPAVCAPVTTAGAPQGGVQGASADSATLPPAVGVVGARGVRLRRNGTMEVPVLCGTLRGCVGELRLWPRRGTKAIGVGKLRIKAGRVGLVRVRLTPAARRALLQRRRTMVKTVLDLRRRGGIRHRGVLELRVKARDIVKPRPARKRASSRATSR